MREAVIHEWCDFCWKGGKVRTEAVGSEVFRVGKNKPRRVAWCEEHSIAELANMVENVGTVEREDSAVSVPKGEFACKCGRSFPSENRLNAHIGQGNRYQRGKHGHPKG